MRKWTRSPDLPYLLALAALFAVSRVVFRLVGVRFSTDQLRIAIQYLDPELLRHHLAQSVWYLHTQPPLYNLFLGTVLKLFPGHEGLAFHAVHLALGLAFVLALYLLLVGFSLPRPAAAAIALLVSVSPAAILYENRLFYDYPVLVLLTLAALAAQRLARRPTVAWALTLSSLLAVVVLVRALYQLPFVLLALLPLLRAVPARVLAAGAALPVAVLVALAVKNAILFGTPSTSSWLGENLARVGIYTAPLDRRRAYVAAGELDPVELIPPYAKLKAYNGAIRFAKPRGVPAVDRFLTSSGKVNLNQWTYLAISRRRLHDDVRFIPSHPGWYARGVKLAAERFFWPPTYPPGITGRNKFEIARWEALWEAGFYGSTPRVNRVGFLALAAYLAALGYGLVVLVRRRGPEAAAIGFVWVVLAWTLAVGVLTDLGENYRSRFPVDPLVVVLVAVATHRLVVAVRASVPRRNAEVLA
jgi:hypothetical protein